MRWPKPQPRPAQIPIGTRRMVTVFLVLGVLAALFWLVVLVGRLMALPTLSMDS